MGKVPLLVAALSLILLACQPWCGEAYNNQRTSWMNEHGKRRGRMDISTTVDVKRQLSGEETAPIQKGWRAELVNTNHRLYSVQNLSSIQRIENNVQTSLARGHALDMKARRAIQSTQPGRKALELDSYLSNVVDTRGSYSMSFSLGTPPQDFLAIADTGSDLVWLQCAACTTCFDQPSPLFDPTVSSTYAPVGCTGCSALGRNAKQCTSTCKYQYSYGDMSRTSGDFSTDVVTLNNTRNTTTVFPSFQFGCGLNNSGTFRNTDGIVGLARGPISFPSQIASYLNDSNRFSYCLDSQDDGADTSSPIVFGSAAQPNNLSDIAYTPILTPFNESIIPYYYVNLTSISVGGVDAGIPASAFAVSDVGYGGTIFDSGTTLTILVPDAYTPVVNLFASQLEGVYTRIDLSTQTGLDLCYDVSGETTLEVPDFVFFFQDAAFDLVFENIFSVFPDGVNTYMCLALLSGGSAFQLNIFGNTQQQNFQVIYDSDQNRIGWERIEDCSTV